MPTLRKLTGLLNLRVTTLITTITFLYRLYNLHWILLSPKPRKQTKQDLLGGPNS